MRGTWRLRQFAKRFLPGVIILLYHRVARLLPDPQLLAVTPEHFAEHLEILRTYGSPLPLKRIDKCLRYPKLGQRAVIVTFDDGYADNLYNAKPLLERYDIPATVFVMTGYLEDNREYFCDELERVLLQPGTLPETLQLVVNEETHQWELGEATRYREEDFERNRFWNVADSGNPTARHSMYRSLHNLLRSRPPEERRRIVDEIVAWAGAESVCRPTHSVLSPDEVCSFADGGLVEVGSHTVTHPVLSALPMVRQKDEMIRSKSRLEQILGGPVTSFAYPYGTRSDYTYETIAAVREAGFNRACANFRGVVWPGQDRWQLPRCLVRDWDGEEFARRLRDWFRE